jgi:hypothetical protein
VLGEWWSQTLRIDARPAAVARVRRPLAAVVTWDAVAPHLDPVALWPTVAIIAAGVMPATSGSSTSRYRSGRTVGSSVGGSRLRARRVVTWEADARLASNFAKLAAYTCVGWAFLRLFEQLSWVVLIAAIIPVVDAVSVFAPKRPTHEIVNHQSALCTQPSPSPFVVHGAAPPGLGQPDIPLFSPSPRAAVRWRASGPGWTWLAMDLDVLR